MLAERTSSWALVCILYFLAGLFVRSWFLGPLFSSLKPLERPIAKELRSAYLKKSFIGWIFFLFPLAIALFMLHRDILPVPVSDKILIALAVFSFAFSVILHLIAFGLASVVTLKKTSETQEKKLFEA